MNFPNSLIRKEKPPLPSNAIFLFHRIYIRHKPGHGWNIKDDLPDFSTLQINEQSCNWSEFSIPIWTRFNDQQVYLKDYAIVAHKVNTIRLIGRILKEQQSEYLLDDFSIDLEHDPIDNNYSHCILKERVALNKNQKRAVRMAFKHKATVCIKPGVEKSSLVLKFQYLIMILNRQISKLLFMINGNYLSGLNNKQ